VAGRKGRPFRRKEAANKADGQKRGKIRERNKNFGKPNHAYHWEGGKKKERPEVWEPTQRRERARPKRSITRHAGGKILLMQKKKGAITDVRVRKEKCITRYGEENPRTLAERRIRCTLTRDSSIVKGINKKGGTLRPKKTAFYKISPLAWP